MDALRNMNRTTWTEVARRRQIAPRPLRHHDCHERSAGVSTCRFSERGREATPRKHTAVEGATMSDRLKKPRHKPASNPGNAHPWRFSCRQIARAVDPRAPSEATRPGSGTAGDLQRHAATIERSWPQAEHRQSTWPRAKDEF